MGSVANLTTKGRPHLIIIIISSSSSSLFERGYKAAHKNTTTCAQKYQILFIFFQYLRKFYFSNFFLKEEEEEDENWFDLKEFFCAESSAHGSVMCVLCVVIIITKEVLRAKGVLGEKKGRNLQPNHERHVLFVVRHLIFFSIYLFIFFCYCWIMTSFSLLYKTKCLVSRKEKDESNIRKRLMNKGRTISQLNSSCSRRRKKKVKQGQIIYATLA